MSALNVNNQTTGTILKYYAIKRGDTYAGHQLAPLYSIDVLRKILNKPPHEMHESIIDYDEMGNPIGCPLYVDIDDQWNLPEAYETSKYICSAISECFGAEPILYYSGGKGFHIIGPVYIRHPRCHEIAKMIALEMSKDVDEQVYRSRGMLRIPSSWNTTGSKYKVEINTSDSLKDVYEISKVQPEWKQRPSFPDINVDRYIEKLPTISEYFADKISTIDAPCIKKIWDNYEPDEGNRHSTIYLLAKYMMSVGTDMPHLISMFASHKFWKSYERREYEKVIRSVYNSGKAMLGCKKGVHAELMRQHCQLLCPYNDNFVIKLRKDDEERTEGSAGEAN
jgi:hypothetical protein